MTTCQPGLYSFNLHKNCSKLTTLSETQYDWRKIEPVTTKANVIHFWCAESEFMVKNQLHNWTSELWCIWHIFGKFGYLALFKHFSTGSNQMLSVLERSKIKSFGHSDPDPSSMLATISAQPGIGDFETFLKGFGQFTAHAELSTNWYQKPGWLWE